MDIAAQARGMWRKMFVAALGIIPRSRGYGKAAMVGERRAGGNTPPHSCTRNWAHRSGCGGKGQQLVASSKRWAGPGQVLEVAAGTKTAAYVRSHSTDRGPVTIERIDAARRANSGCASGA